MSNTVYLKHKSDSLKEWIKPANRYIWLSTHRKNAKGRDLNPLYQIYLTDLSPGPQIGLYYPLRNNSFIFLIECT